MSVTEAIRQKWQHLRHNRLVYMRLMLMNPISLRGRSCRKEYGLKMGLFHCAILFELVIVYFTLDNGFSLVEQNKLSLTGYVLVGLLLWFVASLIPIFALHVRRFHDRNLSGWWVVGLSILVWVPVVSIVVFFIVYKITRKPGWIGPNKYGPDPTSTIDVDTFN